MAFDVTSLLKSVGGTLGTSDPNEFTSVDCDSERSKQRTVKASGSLLGTALSKANNIGLGGQIGRDLGNAENATDTFGGGNTNQTDAQVGSDASGINNPDGPVGQSINNFNPSVVRNASATVAYIGKKIKERDFSVNDLRNQYPAYLQDLVAFKKLSETLFTPPNLNKKPKVCGPEPFILDFIRYQPKFSFLYVVEFTMHPDFISLTDDPAVVALIKQVDRPNIRVEYEDINQYNYHTKSPKHLAYEPISMQMYDDDSGAVLKFVNAWLRITSPITNVTDPVDRGMDFASTNTYAGYSANAYGASIGAPVDKDGVGIKNIFTEISVYHVYDSGNKATRYRYTNPKVMDVNMDELTYEQSTGNTITMQFSYDRVSMNSVDMNLVEEVSERFGRYGLKAATLPEEFTDDDYLVEVEPSDTNEEVFGRFDEEF